MINIKLKNFPLEDFQKVVLQGHKIQLADETKTKVENCHKFLQSFIQDKVIYGINTGLGPMAQYKIEEKDQVSLQKNLIRSHSAGIGEHMSPTIVKGAMLCRLISLSKGYSGVSLATLDVLINFINHDITPVVSVHGGVGASGDLVQLSQIALCLIGEGEVYFEGKLEKTKTILNQLNIPALEIQLREGLALINGTSFMTSIGLLNVLQSKKALDDAIVNGCLINELINSFDDHYSEELNHVKQHPSQRKVASLMREILSSSSSIFKREETYYTKISADKIFEKKVQEYYSLRCLPQILGPIDAAIEQAETVLCNELNSVSDNPIIDIEAHNIFHGGNFHGDFVSAEMNKLKNALIKLTVLTERQLNFLLNNKLNNLFPPFLNSGVLGLNLGLQGAQYAASSTTAESQSLSASIYVHSIPSNNDNQDLVSMGTNEALSCQKIILNFYHVNSVFCLALFQASCIKNKNEELSLRTHEHIAALSKIIPQLSEDRELRPYLENILAYLSAPLNTNETWKK